MTRAQWYFDFISPYAYLQLLRLRVAAQRRTPPTK